MKPYRGVVKGNTLILEDSPEGAEGAEAIVLLKVSEAEDRGDRPAPEGNAAKRFSVARIALQEEGRITWP